MKAFSWKCGDDFTILLVDEFLPKNAYGEKKLSSAWDVFEKELFPRKAVDEGFGWPTRTLPIVFCEHWSDLSRIGVDVPPEFILSRNDFLLTSVANSCTPVERFKRRINYLARVFSSGITEEEFNSWFVGLLRRFCFQDEHIHGGNRLLSLSVEDQAKAVVDFDRWNPNATNPTLEAQWMGARFRRAGKDGMYAVGVNGDELRNYVDFMHRRFGLSEIDEIVGKFVNEDGKNDEVRTENRSLWLELKRVMGNVLAKWVDKCAHLRISHYSLTRKINVLVIDDDATSVIKTLEGAVGLGVFEFDYDDLLNYEVLRSSSVMLQKIVESVRRKVLCGRTYDAILLDLSFAEERNSDLTGYHLIPRLKQLLPQTPIIVHSQFDDMGHIVRALSVGANWFLKKDQCQKLARHMLALISKHEWAKEWQTICAEQKGASSFETEHKDNKAWRDFCTSFTDERKYLTYKCLEKFPGRTILIKPMGGGFSTSATFQAVKVPANNCAPLQSPLIVKIDTAHNTRLEYERYFRFIRPYISNQTGRIDNPERVLDEENAAIVYTFAGKQDGFHELVTMKSLLERDIKNRSSCDYAHYASAFDIIYDEILPRIHAVRPELEFDDISLSDFPNRVFDEIAETKGDETLGTSRNDSSCPIKVEHIARTTDVDAFLANYLCRMPFGKIVSSDDFDIVSQGEAVKSADSVCFEFHAKHISDAGCSMDVYDRDDKVLITLSGVAIDHIVRYRSHTYPSMSMWLGEGKTSNPNNLPQTTAIKSNENGDTVNQERDITDSTLEEKIKSSAFVLDEKVIVGLKMAYAKHAGISEEEVESVVASNWFSKLVFNLLQEELIGGLPTSHYFDGLGDAFHKTVATLANREKTAFASEIELFEIVQMMLKDEKCRMLLMQVPVGIVHGDLNYANIMLESRKCVMSREGDSRTEQKFNDVWFIDFARTRRDFIMHDYGVAFTATLALLFDKDVWVKSISVAHRVAVQMSSIERKVLLKEEMSYQNLTNLVFRDFVEEAVFGRLDAVPDCIEEDRRYSFVFQMLRRIRRAALKEGVSHEAYALSVALACMVASRIYLVYEENAPASAGMMATAFICLARLRRWQMEVVKS